MQNNNFNCSWFCSQTKVLNKCAYIVHIHTSCIKMEILKYRFHWFSQCLHWWDYTRKVICACTFGRGLRHISRRFSGLAVCYFSLPSSQFSILSSEFSVCKSVLAYNKCRHLHLFRTEAREREREIERWDFYLARCLHYFCCSFIWDFYLNATKSWQANLSTDI